MKSTTSINFDCKMLKELKQYAYENNRSVSSAVCLLISNSELYQKFIRERELKKVD